MSAAVNLKVKVHPVVLLQIADSYERRSQENHRVIGTLVGSVDKQSVEVTNCFCIPHKEYEERVEADIVYAQDMYELNRKVPPLRIFSSPIFPDFRWHPMRHWWAGLPLEVRSHRTVPLFMITTPGKPKTQFI